ncbi:cytochrome c oxidase subunit 7C, mitochondrial [Diachasma alloeum]|uniref:Cytochrome c oxidase subunit 7C, mitochondrial n=1 Tax=Diachasma alloeum TaxID=454923 RepID=A0A4E0RYW3_9HYME|nr:cytochrome c oxidase subunit 7C, mitochondrial [Diachasma alloeum]THK32981.1 polypedptide VIIC, cytochrome c oxidase [Diachasma alloeum]
MLSQQLVRRFATSALRRSGNPEVGAKPGHNLPFTLGNRYKLTVYFILYFGSAFATPFLVVRHQLLK